MSPLDVRISALLRIGVGISLVTILLGTAVSFLHHPEYVSSEHALAHLTAPGSAPRTLGDVLSGIADGRGQAIVMLGLLVLLATPVMRVAISCVVFIREGDRPYAAMTGIVLVLILTSLLLGRTSR